MISDSVATIGCAALIAAVPFALGLLAALLMPGDATLGERLPLGIIPGGAAFVAAAVLIARDRLRHALIWRKVQQMLLVRDDVSDDVFLAYFPDADPGLTLQVRDAISRYFEAPAAKIHPTDDPHKDLRFQTLAPDAHFFVTSYVLTSRNVVDHMVVINPSELNNIRDLVLAIERLLAPTDAVSHNTTQQIRD